MPQGRQQAAGTFDACTLDELSIEDERSFRHVGLYGDLKDILRRAAYRFRVLPPSSADRWDRALLLNLTFWRPDDGGDVLVDKTIPADVVAHVAWHHLAAGVFAPAPGRPPSVHALFMGEAIASAFDLYLVGRLLGHAPESSFLATQVPAMTETAEAAGMTEETFATLLQDITDAPERAFADLRELLFDASSALYASGDAEQAFLALARFDSHRFAALLHRYELSNWVLYARAYGGSDEEADNRARDVDKLLREQKDPLDWLAKNWM
ncbi:MAG: hypothetical protein H7X95_10205 [Deltaproteobacteria bacterium]|nr:hypothetical protein [Deltaproteobacteria bacterium]